MKHIDEGTIHAWLDGALNETQANEVSQHAASCAECGALVAEARGLIAGASRILTSLDDVPAVVPRRAAVVASSKPQRFWQAAPWVTGIAAALILAVGIKEWIDRPSAKAAFEPVHVVMDSLRAAPIPAPTPVDSALRQPERRALAPVSAPPPAVSRLQAGGAGASGGGPATEPPRKQNELAKKDASADEVAAAKVTSAPVSPTAVAPAPAPAPAAAQGLALESVSRRDEKTLAGCYRLESVPPPVAPTQAKLPAAARTQDRSTARLAPSASAAAAPSAADFSIPSILRLDTTTLSQGRRPVVSPATGETVGTWRAVGGDSVRLLLLYAGAQTLSSPNRVACPEAPRARP